MWPVYKERYQLKCSGESLLKPFLTPRHQRVNAWDGNGLTEVHENPRVVVHTHERKARKASFMPTEQENL